MFENKSTTIFIQKQKQINSNNNNNNSNNYVKNCLNSVLEIIKIKSELGDYHKHVSIIFFKLIINLLI